MSEVLKAQALKISGFQALDSMRTQKYASGSHQGREEGSRERSIRIAPVEIILYSIFTGQVLSHVDVASGISPPKKTMGLAINKLTRESIN